LNQSYYLETGFLHGGQAYLVTPEGIDPTTDEETGTDLYAMSVALMQAIPATSGIELYHPLAVYSGMIFPSAAEQGSPRDLTVLQAMSNRIAGRATPNPNPENAPIVPPVPPVNLLNAPNFAPLPLPGTLPPGFGNQPFEALNVPIISIENVSTTHILSGVLDMATFTKVTFFYQQLNQGWQEVYYNQASTIAQCLPLAQNLGSALMAFRGSNTALINFRISLQEVPLSFPRLRTVRLFPPLPGWEQGSFTQVPPPNPPENWSDFFSAAALIKGVPATFGQTQKSIFMRGLPDEYDIGGGNLAGQLWQFFGMPRTQNLQRAFAGGGTPFGWLGTVRPADMTTVSSAISSIVQNANGTVTITTANPIASVPVSALGNSNRHFPIRISGARTGPINGTLPVWCNLLGTIFTTTKRIAITAFDGAGGTLTYLPKTFIPFSSTIITAPRGGNVTTYGNCFALRISTRKAGAIFGVSKGRVRNRVRA
jgi:hypothetical protein